MEDKLLNDFYNGLRIASKTFPQTTASIYSLIKTIYAEIPAKKEGETDEEYYNRINGDELGKIDKALSTLIIGVFAYKSDKCKAMLSYHLPNGLQGPEHKCNGKYNHPGMHECKDGFKWDTPHPSSPEVPESF